LSIIFSTSVFLPLHRQRAIVHLLTFPEGNCSCSRVAALSHFFFFQHFFYFFFLLVIDSPTAVTIQSSPSPPPLPLPPPLPPPPPLSSEKEHQFQLIEEAKQLLNIIVQLGNRQEIEQLLNKIKVKKKKKLKNLILA